MTTTHQLQADQRNCPRCSAVIKLSAHRCRYCNKLFSTKEILDAYPPPTEAQRRFARRAWKAIGWTVLGMMVLGGVLNAMGVKTSRGGNEFASHCASPWDGSVSQVVQYVKARMHDPGSFEHVESRIGRTKYGTNGVVMTYRGKNGFGGMRSELAVVTIDNDDCSVRP